jgi:hypothetical protein
MVSPSRSTLVHSLKKPHWRIDVHRPKGVRDPWQFTVFLTGIVAPDFHRSRYMELGHFVAFTNSLEEARRRLPDALAEVSRKDVPSYPHSIGRLLASGSMYEIHVFLTRRCCSVETTLSVYDLDDDAAPMLNATDHEIEELSRDCIDTLRKFKIELDELDAA